MQAQETHFLGNNYTWNIPVSAKRRQIVVPLLLAIARNGKARAYHKLFLNGVQVEHASAQGAIYPNGASAPDADTQTWIGYIEANQAVTLRANSETESGGKTPAGVTVLISTVD